MKVLQINYNWPQLSESYIKVEQDFARRNGVEYSSFAPQNFSGLQDNTFRDLEEALKWRPDILHYHKLSVAWQYRDLQIPSTVRVHSCELVDHAYMRPPCTASRTKMFIENLTPLNHIKRFYCFPVLAAELKGSKIFSLPVAFHDYWEKEVPKDPKLVIRQGVLQNWKRLEDFYEAAELKRAEIPSYKFVLALARGASSQYYTIPDTPHVTHKINITTEESSDLYAKATTYLHTYPRSCKYAMSISLFEAAAARCHVLSPYAFDTYQTIDEAVKKIGGPFQNPREYALQFTDEKVLPNLLQDWKRIKEENL